MAKVTMEYPEEDFEEDEKLAKKAQKEKEAKDKKFKELEERKQKREIREKEINEYEKWLIGKNAKPEKKPEKTVEQKERIKRRKELKTLITTLKKIDEDINPNHKKKESVDWPCQNYDEEKSDEIKIIKTEHVGAWDKYSLHTVSKLKYPAVKDNCKPKPAAQSFTKPQKYINSTLPIQLMKAKALKAAAN